MTVVWGYGVCCGHGVAVVMCCGSTCVFCEFGVTVRGVL